MTQPTGRPFTGEEYLESLRDGRAVYIYGERVKDVTTHPAFRNAARMIARLYDALHDPARATRLTVPTDTGSGGRTHPFFVAPRSADDLLRARDAIAEWARMTYGWMGRTPDYKASFLGTLGANAAFYAPYEENARRWYRLGQERVLYWNHAIVHPPVDRNRPPHEVADVYVHVVKETDAGVIVRGAKVVATGSALTHHNFVAHYATPSIGGLKDPRFALIFCVPMDTPGLKLFCRPSYEATAAVMGSPWDYPLSSRFDENDAIMVFDNVLVPWENIFVYGDIDKADGFFPASGFIPRFAFHGCVRFAVKLDFIAGVLLKAVEAAGTKDFRGIQARVGEVLAWRHLFWSLTEAMARDCIPWGDGYVIPKVEYAQAYRVLAPTAWSRVRQIILDDVASSLVYLPSHVADVKNPEERVYLDKYVRGSNGYDAYARIKVMKLLYDATISEFAGRHELYERNYAGSHEDTRLQTFLLAEAMGLSRELRSFADQCLSEYDLDGWTVSDLVGNDDVSWILARLQQTGGAAMT